jgi:hypothetical protein
MTDLPFQRPPDLQGRIDALHDALDKSAARREELCEDSATARGTSPDSHGSRDGRGRSLLDLSCRSAVPNHADYRRGGGMSDDEDRRDARAQRMAEDRAEYDDPDHYLIDRNQNRYEKWMTQ